MEAYQRRYRWHLRFERVRRVLRTTGALVLVALLSWLVHRLDPAPPPPPPLPPPPGKASAPAGPSGTAAGSAEAIDGDSLRVRQADGTPRETRLKGMDAVEYRQTCRDAAGAQWACGKEARAALAVLTAQGVRCTVEGEDRYRRALGHCQTPTGVDVAARMVANGWAVASDGDTGGDGYAGSNGAAGAGEPETAPGADNRSYRAEEQAARAARLGIWRGRFMHPSEWRARAAKAREAGVDAANRP